MNKDKKERIKGAIACVGYAVYCVLVFLYPESLVASGFIILVPILILELL